MKKLLVLVPILLLAASVSNALTGTTGNATLNLTVGPEAQIQVDSSDSFSTSSSFAAYTATTNFKYFIRTSSGGTGTITLQADADWTGGTGGPSIATPPTAGDALSYVTTVSLPGNKGTDGSVALLNNAYTVVTFGNGASSAITGNTGSEAWTLTNDPTYKQGSYSVMITFTISAT